MDEQLPAEEEDAGDGVISAEENALAEEQAIEAEAYRQGWRPLDEYRGPPGKWVDAKTFLERGERYLPFVQKERDEGRQRITAMTREIEEMRGTMAEQSEQLRKLLEYSRRADQAGYDRAVRELKAKQRQAASEGNMDAFDEIGGQIEQMEDARAASAETREQAPATPERPAIQPRRKVEPAIDAFIAENPWFQSDPVLNPAMIAAHNQIISQSPGLPLADQLEAAKEIVMEQYPEKFGRRRQQTPPKDQQPAPKPKPRGPLTPGPSRAVASQRQGDPFDQIEDTGDREEARAGYRRSLRSMPDLTAQEYIDTFLEPHGDVLRTIRSAKAPARRANNARA